VFTGIVEAVGEVVDLTPRGHLTRLVIEAPSVAGGVRLGDSVAVNGACLTVTESDGPRLGFEAVKETLDLTALGDLGVGSRVNLERALRADGRLDGHIVQGHVDGTGQVISRGPSQHWEVVRISLPAELSRYVVEKGSITVDGISLTVSALGGDWFEVSLIPTTLALTTLGRAPVGTPVNLEVDVIAKYVERLMSQKSASSSGDRD
jgi:riboflavin synthase